MQFEVGNLPFQAQAGLCHPEFSVSYVYIESVTDIAVGFIYASPRTLQPGHLSSNGACMHGCKRRFG